MPALPWMQGQGLDPASPYTVMASRLPLQAYRHVPGSLRDTRRIRRRLAHADGLVGSSLNAEPANKTFWTLSVWTDRASLEALAATDPHRRIIQRLRPRMHESRFEFLTLTGAEAPSEWPQMMALVR